MSKISQLENYISIKRSYGEVKRKALSINKMWRSETWTRALRKSASVKAIKKDPTKPNSSNIAYMPINIKFKKNEIKKRSKI